MTPDQRKFKESMQAIVRDVVTPEIDKLKNEIKELKERVNELENNNTATFG